MKRATAVTLAFLFVAAAAQAVTTRYIEQNGYFDFLKGRFAGISLDDKGTVSLSPSFKGLLDFNEMYVWCIAENSKGDIYGGTGNNGIIYRVASSNASSFFDSGGTELTALAVDADDYVYAGLSPKGIIYRISPAGQSSVFAALKSSYIWEMAFDSKKNLFVASGDAAAVWKIAPTGAKELFFESSETHFVALVIDKNDNCYVAGSKEGLVYKITPEGKKQVLFDSQGQEITALAVDRNGAVFIGTGEKSDRSGLMLSAGQKQPSEAAGKDQPFSFQGQKQMNCVWKVTEDGRSAKVIELSDQTFISMTVDDKDNVYVGCANNGEIYRIAPDETVVKLFNLDAMQILCLYWSLRSGKLYAGTGNLGNIYTIAPVYVREGEYFSEVFDARYKSWFGSLSWTSEKPDRTDVYFRTRSGNSGVPDEMWSDWSAPLAVPAQHIPSPMNRFLQYKLTLVTSNQKQTPKVSGVRFSFRQFNQKPAIQKFDMEFPQNDKKDPSKNGKLKGSLAPNERKLTWEATDPNEDQLSFATYFRPRDNPGWLLLSDKIDGTSLVFDSLVLPDGYYYFRLAASDLPSNTAADALTEESVSRLLLIDNQPPEIFDLKARKTSETEYEVTGRVADALSDVGSIEYSFNTADWVFVLPDDRIYDSSSEKFTFKVKLPAASGNFLILKLMDSSRNMRTVKLGF